ncbi:uncharacterized protein LACBIDRAFT_295701 [Laccaria bicolor S238N-H82]|uniref:Predicted protein n=1 Tax=Laccaria bicolor (strain S238N-H82 / ATCC MYA-4686) TaxID=486041 RepID=B0DXD2_LACBS|nr:uncharacterized protein LACBIDRAFT_295701 [Laccaria bicolor S238N-H82]EDR00771.1 predicted protein [Laccaria bicolor S238N-H82]|eukprot:XP_001888563.1 predicted protein [Laccaria bicolor S238N-H82]
MKDFPNEIRFHVFAFLPLKSLITGRSVSQEWRRLIPLADITPIRRALLDFYLTLIVSPIFPQTRPWVLANLQPFDRQQYIDDLMDQHPFIPEAFRVWILEWPAKAVIGCVWPGLPNVHCTGKAADYVHRIEGNNLLSPLPPTICALPYLNYTPNAHFIPALFIFHALQETVWLMLDERDSLRDKVFTLSQGGSDLFDEEGESEDYDIIDDDWIGWQKRTWGRMELWAKRRAEQNLPILRLEDMPPPNTKHHERVVFTKSFRRGQLQAHTWRERKEANVRLDLYFSMDDDHMRDVGERIPRTGNRKVFDMMDWD